MLRDVLSFISEEYPAAISLPLKGNAVAQLIRQEAPKELKAVIANDHYLIEGSPGQGNWADIPWLAVFDPTITTSATRGYYVVYLFSADMSAVYLCLGQGTTSVREEFKSKTHEELKRLAALMRARLTESNGRFSQEDIQLGGRSQLSRDYEPAVALNVRYDTKNLPSEEQIKNDLLDMLKLYARLVARGGRENFEDQQSAEVSETEGSTIEERRRYRQHRKIERSSKAAKLAKQAHGCICQGCGFDFSQVYGAIGKGYIEAHHLTPLSELPEDEPVSLNVYTDFAVLCANCHRMVHRKGGPKTLADLIALPGVIEMRGKMAKT